MDTIKRQTRAVYAGHIPMATRCMWHNSAAAGCSLWRYLSAICLCLCVGWDVKPDSLTVGWVGGPNINQLLICTVYCWANLQLVWWGETAADCDCRMSSLMQNAVEWMNRQLAVPCKHWAVWHIPSHWLFLLFLLLLWFRRVTTPYNFHVIAATQGSCTAGLEFTAWLETAGILKRRSKKSSNCFQKCCCTSGRLTALWHFIDLVLFIIIIIIIIKKSVKSLEFSSSANRTSDESRLKCLQLVGNCLRDMLTGCGSSALNSWRKSPWKDHGLCCTVGAGALILLLYCCCFSIKRWVRCGLGSCRSIGIRVYCVVLSPIPATDFFVNVHSVIQNKWQFRWNLHPNNKLYKIYPNVSTLPPLPNTFTRKEQTTLNRLLIGHSHLTHSYLINKDPEPLHVITVNVF